MKWQDLQGKLKSSWLSEPTQRLYHLGLKLHKKSVQNSYESPHKVISIGNLSVGGTGKTPVIMEVAKILENSGPQRKLAVVTRGYKSEQSQPREVTDPKAWREFGDEPALIKSRLSYLSVLCGSQKYRTVQWWDECHQFDDSRWTYLIDDGFQHWRLKRDADIVLIDATVTDDTLLPVGLFREPFSSASRAQCLLLTKTNLASSEQLEFHHNWMSTIGPPVFEVEYHSQCELPEKTPVVLVTGLGNGQSVKKDVENRYPVVQHIEYPDHFHYRKADLESIHRSWEAAGVSHVLTTSKDAIKMGETPFPLAVLDLEVQISDAEKFQQLITQWV